MPTVAEYKQRSKRALASGLAAHNSSNGNGSGCDMTSWPADVQDTIATVCRLWNLELPNTKTRKAYWITGARDLIDACGEWGVHAIIEYRKAFKQYMEDRLQKGQPGTGPIEVDSPKSLVNVVCGMAAKMRSNGYVISDDGHRYSETDPGQHYIGGKYADFIEH